MKGEKRKFSDSVKGKMVENKRNASVQRKMVKKKRNVSESLNIPEEIIFNVLIRLPAKTLMRFKCVCKVWLALIRDPYFTEPHYLHAQSRSDASYLISFRLNDWFNHSDKYLEAEAIIPTDPQGNISTGIPCHSLDNLNPRLDLCSEIVNGLICLSLDNLSNWRVCIRNLTTGEQILLPKQSKKNYSHFPSSKFIGFNLIAYCIGFDPITKTYKVLFIPTKLGQTKMECEILTLGTKSWRKMDCPLYHRIAIRKSVSVNGAIYFQTWKFARDLERRRRNILYFDLRSEKFLEIIPPADAAFVYQISRVGENFALLGKSESGRNLNLWTLEHENQVWEEREIFLSREFLYDYELVGSTITKQLLFSISGNCCDTDKCCAVLYDLTEGKCWKLEMKIPGQPQMLVNAIFNKYSLCIVASNHVENILPLKNFGARKEQLSGEVVTRILDY